LAQRLLLNETKFKIENSECAVKYTSKNKKGVIVMKLVKWNPTNLMVPDIFDRMFDEMNRSLGVLNPTVERIWRPNVDVSEDQDNYYVHVEVPGMKKEDLHIDVENHVLVIKGEKKFEKKDEDMSYHRMERQYGTFERRFNLTDEIQIDKIEATYADGILTITLPKAEKVKPRDIEIKVK